MQGKKIYQEKLFLSFRLSDHVPSDNLYRQLNEVIDFSFLYKLTKKYYGSEGQKSIDPVVFMKLMLVGFLENLNSDRRIINALGLRLDIRYFIGYDLDEQLPWHSTLSRTRRLYEETVFEELFSGILKQCVDKGMISGRRQAIDGVFIKANASLDSLVLKEVLAEAITYSEELRTNEDEPVAIEQDSGNEPPKKDYNGLKPKKNPNNKTHYSPTDPDAKMSVKTGKVPALNYLGQVCVDTASHVITHVQAFRADLGDSTCLPEVLRGLIDNLSNNDLRLEEVVADKGYSSGKALKALEDNHIKGYIPNRPQFIYKREDVVFHSIENHYTCQNGKLLTYRGITIHGDYSNHNYRLRKSECNGCPFKEQCSVYGKNGPSIKETTDKPYYNRMHLRMQTRKASILMKKRQSTVEPVIGTLVNYLAIKKISSRGLPQANKCLTVAAVAYNLKKLIKHTSKFTKNKPFRHSHSCKKPNNNLINMYLAQIWTNNYLLQLFGDIKDLFLSSIIDPSKFNNLFV
jgi:transposase